MRETLVFLDVPAAEAIAAAAELIAARGLTITHRSAFAVAFTGRDAGAAAVDAGAHGASVVGPHSAGAGTLPLGSGQIAAVSVQLKPEWSRVWVTVNGDEGAAAAAAAAYVETHRETSRRIEAAVAALERDIYAEAQWPQYEANLRAGLRTQGVDEAAIDAKIAAFKKRWTALGRKVAAAPPEEGPPAA